MVLGLTPRTAGSHQVAGYRARQRNLSAGGRLNRAMRYVRAFAALAALSVLLPSSAFGQTPKRPDPDTPAGVEYQLPLDQARKNVAPDGDAKPRSGGDTRADAVPLFGAGIVARTANKERDGQNGTGDGDPGTERGSEASTSGDGQAGDGEAADSGDPPTRKAAVGAGDAGDGGAMLRAGGIALAVLIAGGLLGLALRRGLRQSPD